MDTTLPPLTPGLLTPANSSRVILDALAEQHYQNKDTLGAAKQTLEAWARALSHNAAPQQEVELLVQDREISFSQILEAMDGAQSTRFLNELFSDVIPHLSSQKAFFADLERGHTEGGMRVTLDPQSQLSKALMDSLPPDALALLQDVRTHTQALTWVDDNLNTFQTHMTLDVTTDGQTPSSNVRKLNF